MHQCTTFHCTVCLPMHQCTKVEPAPLCTMHYAIVEAHQSKQALCTMHNALCTAQELDQLHYTQCTLHCSRVGPAPPPAPGLRWSAPPVSTRWAPACTFCTQEHSTVHNAGLQYVCKSSAQYNLVLCTALCAQKATRFAVQVLLFPL